MCDRSFDAAVKRSVLVQSQFDGREWCCTLQEEVEAFMRVGHSKRRASAACGPHKKIPSHTCPSLMSNKKKDSQKETRGPRGEGDQGPRGERRTRGAPWRRRPGAPWRRRPGAPWRRRPGAPVEKRQGPRAKETRGPKEERKEVHSLCPEEGPGLSQTRTKPRHSEGHKAVRAAPNEQAEQRPVREETEKTTITRSNP
uniref:Uncharacterized protein n=1 Tax=Knipowitschia caucasica TaxID=637954 RepID=A0AAV2M6L5_KNICA